jgi:NitT/TauT family transport system substrate-binding protein
MRQIFPYVFATLVFLLLPGPIEGMAAEKEAGGDKLVPVTFLPQWTPQSQFAGYYMAGEKGFYRQRGLDVRILDGGPDKEPFAWLASGKADFATSFLTGAVAARDRGIPVVLASQVVNRSNLMLIAWRRDGITRVEDLQGHKINLWEDTKLGFLLFLKAHRVEPKILPQYYSVNLFLARGVSACAGMYYNEFHRIYQAGVDPGELTCFSLQDYGYGFPEDGIYCLEKTPAVQPRIRRAFAEASLEGWRYAAQHPDETLDVVMRRVRDAHAPTNRAHMKWMLEKILASIFPGPKDSWKVGELSREDYARTVDTMRTLGFISRPRPYNEFCGKEPSHAP